MPGEHITSGNILLAKISVVNYYFDNNVCSTMVLLTVDACICISLRFYLNLKKSHILDGIKKGRGLNLIQPVSPCMDLDSPKVFFAFGKSEIVLSSFLLIALRLKKSRHS